MSKSSHRVKNPWFSWFDVVVLFFLMVLVVDCYQVDRSDGESEVSPLIEEIG